LEFLPQRSFVFNCYWSGIINPKDSCKPCLSVTAGDALFCGSFFSSLKRLLTQFQTTVASTVKETIMSVMNLWQRLQKRNKLEPRGTEKYRKGVVTYSAYKAQNWYKIWTMQLTQTYYIQREKLHPPTYADLTILRRSRSCVSELKYVQFVWTYVHIIKYTNFSHLKTISVVIYCITFGKDK
jgi:hypothetical protein